MSQQNGKSRRADGVEKKEEVGGFGGGCGEVLKERKQGGLFSLNSSVSGPQIRG